MGRLIDADALMEKLNVFNDNVNGNEHFINGIETAKELLGDMPTAYDVEKVVEQLVTIHVEGHCPSESLECVLSKTCDDCYREIVTEIVRKGGVE